MATRTHLLIPDSAPLLARAVRFCLDPQRHDVLIAPLETPQIQWCDAVLPLDLPNQLVLKTLFPGQSGRKYMVAPIRAIRICADKLQFARFMIANGLGVVASVGKHVQGSAVRGDVRGDGGTNRKRSGR